MLDFNRKNSLSQLSLDDFFNILKSEEDVHIEDLKVVYLLVRMIVVSDAYVNKIAIEAIDHDLEQLNDPRDDEIIHADLVYKLDSDHIVLSNLIDSHKIC